MKSTTKLRIIVTILIGSSFASFEEARTQDLNSMFVESFQRAEKSPMDLLGQDQERSNFEEIYLGFHRYRIESKPLGYENEDWLKKRLEPTFRQAIRKLESSDREHSMPLNVIKEMENSYLANERAFSNHMKQWSTHLSVTDKISEQNLFEYMAVFSSSLYRTDNNLWNKMKKITGFFPFCKVPVDEAPLSDRWHDVELN